MGATSNRQGNQLQLEEIARRTLRLIDLTSLNGDEDEGAIVSLCERANTTFGPVAAVCIYPQWVERARSELGDGPVRIATVVNFPEGDQDAEHVAMETAEAIENGADEIDVVLPWREWLAEEHVTAIEVIESTRAACPSEILMKVIIESGEFPSPANIAGATRDVIEAGADFVKTSTGKTEHGASLQAAEVILETIANSGANVGFKASGGIRTTADAGEYLQVARSIMGEEWISPDTMRFGASSLLDDVLEVLAG